MKNKIILLSGLICICTAANIFAQDTSAWKTLVYKNYTIKYPPGKRLAKNNSEGNFTLYLMPDRLPEQTDNILMQINDIAGYMLDLESYSYQFSDVYFRYYNVTILEDQEMVLNNQPCHRFLTERDDGHGEVEIKTMVYIWVKNNWAYNLIFSSTPENYDRFLPIAQKVAETFTFTK